MTQHVSQNAVSIGAIKLMQMSQIWAKGTFAEKMSVLFSLEEGANGLPCRGIVLHAVPPRDRTRPF
jgi:hypothetical protein